MSTFLILSVLQGAAILIDEIFFHHKRGLPRWERIGHPIDTATVLSCLLFLSFAPRTPMTEWIYIGLAIASTICITKDEWVHRKFCTGTEMWLHAVLFIVHPLLLYVAYHEWEISRFYFQMVSVGVTAFFFYQIIYWNVIEYRLREKKRIATFRRATDQELYDYFAE
ncbi:MAG: hypothetical protein J7501_16275 [Bdellovibrio sp.]|nr:hypothetical protein [Bdellovibrio sp.]